APYRKAHLAPECAVTSPQQHRYVAGLEVGGCQVKDAVAVEITDNHGTRSHSHCVPHRVLKRAISISQEDSEIGAVSLGGREVRVAVAVEIAHDDPVCSPERSVCLHRWA